MVAMGDDELAMLLPEEKAHVARLEERLRRAEERTAADRAASARISRRAAEDEEIARRAERDAAGLVALLGELDDRIAAMVAELEGGPAAPEVEEEGSEIWEEASLPGPRISVGPRSDRTHSYELEAAPTDAALRLPRLESFKI